MYLGAIRAGALAVLAIAVPLGGCADVGWDTGGWFRKPMDAFGRNAGYSFSDLQENRQFQPITNNDLVDASGACPAGSAPAPTPAPGDQPGGPVAGGDAAALSGGVGLGMSECEVVARAGQPASVQIGANPNGDRTAVLTYNGGPRPGVYHFERGRLMQMDRVDLPPPPQVAKKKPAKPKKQAVSNNAT